MSPTQLTQIREMTASQEEQLTDSRAPHDRARENTLLAEFNVITDSTYLPRQPTHRTPQHTFMPRPTRERRKPERFDPYSQGSVDSQSSKADRSSRGEIKSKAAAKPLRQPKSTQPSQRVLLELWCAEIPPPAISYNSSTEVEVPSWPECWNSSQAVKLATSRAMDIVRHFGTIELGFHVVGNVQNVYSKLTVPNEATSFRPPKGLYSSKLTTIDDQFDENGEPTMPRGFTSVHRLLAAIDEKKVVAPKETRDVLEALNGYIVPECSPWQLPLIRVVIPCPTPNVLKNLKLHVYASRPLFEMIANTSLATIVGAMSSESCRPTYSLKHNHKETFLRSKKPSNDFTTRALLQSQESTGYSDCVQPDGLKMTMLEYQRHSLQWMRDQESLEFGLNGVFWEERSWPEGDSFYFSPSLGELRIEKPDFNVKGGLLCEEMGLGKTLICTALILGDKTHPNQCPTQNSASEQITSTKCTLVIVPESLVSQWVREIAKATDLLKVGVLINWQKTRPSAERTKRKRNVVCGVGTNGEVVWDLEEPESSVQDVVMDMATSHDVLLTTYHTVTMIPELNKLRWRRLIVDEMQEIRSSTQRIALMCRRLESTRRWMVSGTPLFDGVNDLNGELAFLGVIPFCLPDMSDGFWGHAVSGPWNHGNSKALDILNTLLSAVMIRHSKAQTYLDQQTSILQLPSMTHHYEALEPDPSETGVTKYLEALSRFHITEESEHNVNQLLLRLQRLACISPVLLNGGGGCSSQLADVDTLARRRLRTTRAALGEQVKNCREMDAESAIEALLVPQVQHQSGGSLRQNFDAQRSYGLTSLETQLIQTEAKMDTAQKAILITSQELALTRWRRAVRFILSGRYLIVCMATRNMAEFQRVVGVSSPPRISQLVKLLPLVARVVSTERKLDIAKSTLESLSPEELVRRSQVKAQSITKETKLLSASAMDVEEEDSDSEVDLAIGKRRKRRALPDSVKGDSNDSGSEMATDLDKSFGDSDEFEDTERSKVDRNPRVRERIELQLLETREHKNAQDAVKRFPAVFNGKSITTHSLAVTDKRIRELAETRAQEKEKLEALVPYHKLLQKAKVLGASADAVEQSGLANLQAMAHGSPPPNCSICFQVAESPVVTPCVHISCEECLFTWLNVSRATAHPHARLEQIQTTCPLCRRHFGISDIIRVVPKSKEESVEDEMDTTNGGEGTSSCSTSPPSDSQRFQFSAAATEEEFARLHVPQPLALLEPRLPALSRPILTHLRNATGLPANSKPPTTSRAGSKARALIRDLHQLFATEGPQAKAVVFSSQKECVNHLHSILNQEGISNVKICKGDHQNVLIQAISKFSSTRSGDSAAVFLLHASSAAAGLTLTQAHSMFFMEPFLSTGQLAQAMNRCHRIGQTQGVVSKTYYFKHTVEERYLAWMQSTANLQGMGDEEDTLHDISSLTKAEQNSRHWPPAKIHYVFGIAEFME